MATNQNSVASVLDRAVGVGGSGTQNLGLYKDANGATTTYRPEFAGQTVQVGSQYVTYNEQGYPTKSLNADHAKNLGNSYTQQNLGLDQTKISNAADIYRGIYNATMTGGSILQNNDLSNAYGKRNIQYSNNLGVEDYDKLISDAAAKGSNVLAGFYEDSRNALLQSLGHDSEQTSHYNGGWNYVDNGGGVGNIYTGAMKDSMQADQTLGGGWYAGQGKGNAAEEYFSRNTDAPSMQEVLRYAAAKGYDTEDENAVIPYGALSYEMMTNGYVSPSTLQKAEALKSNLPAVLKNLGIEGSSSGTGALETAIRNMQSAGSGSYAETMRQMMAQGTGTLSNPYGAAYGSSAGGNGYSNSVGGGYGGSSLENELMNFYGTGGSYAAMLQQLKNQVDAQVQQATSGYNAQKNQVNDSYADLFRQLYIDRENSKKNLAQQMAAYGVTGGAAESTLLGLDTNYQNALQKGEQGRVAEINELEQAILQAQLTGDISYAEQALKWEQDRLNNYANVLQNMLNRQDAAQQQAYKYQQAAQEEAFNKQMEKAELLASIGDFSGYKVLGLTDSEIAALEKMYAEANAARSSSGGGSKPALTLAQTQNLLNDGVVTDKTLYAYEYYTGQPWVSEDDGVGTMAGKSSLVFSDLIDVMQTGNGTGVKKYVESIRDSLTEVQKKEVQKLLDQNGYTFPW